MNKGIRHRYDISTDSSLGRMRSEVVSWLGLILLAFNMLAGSGIATQASASNQAPFVQELLGDRIVVCTAGGMVVLDRDGHPVQSDSGAGHADFCVFCLPLMHGGVQAPIAMTFVIAPIEHRQPELVPDQPSHPKPARLAGSASPRAPPFA